MANILVVAAHPDDEILGCGGTVALHARKGDTVTSVIACEGHSVRYEGQDINLEDCARQAGKVLGVEDVRFLDFPDQKLDTLTLTKIITPLEKIVREVQPSLIYCQHGGDINKDHKLLFEALLVAARPGEACIEGVYAFDTVSSTEWAWPRNFIPDTWVDISSTLEQKLEALGGYHSEMHPFPHSRAPLKACVPRPNRWARSAIWKRLKLSSPSGEPPVMAKRLFDIIFSLTALIVLSPLLLIGALGIKLTSPGPVLFRGKRIGKDGVPFSMHKLRTMRVIPEGQASSITALNDPRIFAWGSFLRKSKIDEFPQFYDVLRGKMSVVGPRPEAPDIVENYYTPEMMETLQVKPGITSPGALLGYQRGHEFLGNPGDAEDAHEAYVNKMLKKKLDLEIEYVKNAGFVYDIKLIGKTLLAIFRIMTGLDKKHGT